MSQDVNLSSRACRGIPYLSHYCRKGFLADARNDSSRTVYDKIICLLIKRVSPKIIKTAFFDLIR